MLFSDSTCHLRHLLRSLPGPSNAHHHRSVLLPAPGPRHLLPSERTLQAHGPHKRKLQKAGGSPFLTAPLSGVRDTGDRGTDQEVGTRLSSSPVGLPSPDFHATFRVNFLDINHKYDHVISLF